MLHKIFNVKARNLGYYRGFNGFKPLWSRTHWLLLSDSEVEPCLRQLTALGYTVAAISVKKPGGDELASELDKVPPDK